MLLEGLMGIEAGWRQQGEGSRLAPGMTSRMLPSDKTQPRIRTTCFTDCTDPQNLP